LDRVFAAKLSKDPGPQTIEYCNHVSFADSLDFVKTQDIYEGSGYSILQMELCSGPDLRGGRITEPDACTVVLTIGLSHIHCLGLIHLDLSRSNIVKRGDTCKLGTSGSSGQT
jgi:serine/threonine protein kinase